MMLNVQIADERDDRFLAYSTSQENEPPSGMTNRIRSGDKYDQEIYFFWGTTWDHSKKKPGPYSVYVELYTKKPYTRLVIKEISYFYEGKTGLVVENAEFSLPKTVAPLDGEANSWLSDGKHYWLNGESFAHPVDRTKGWPCIDFYSLFYNHQTIDEEFDFQLKLVYQFDDDEVKTETLKYKITVISKWKGPHPSIWWW